MSTDLDSLKREKGEVAQNCQVCYCCTYRSIGFILPGTCKINWFYSPRCLQVLQINTNNGAASESGGSWILDIQKHNQKILNIL